MYQRITLILFFLTTPALGILSGPAFSQEEASSIEINGDTVEFVMAENKFIAKGNVSIIKQDVTLLCDQLEFYRNEEMAVANGNVVMIRPDGRLEADKMTFNFGTMKGDFFDARFASKPFYGRGETISRLGENHMVMRKGYMTTCDLDKPHFRMLSKTMDIYPGDKMVARNVRLLAGKVPLIFIPRYTQDLSGKKPVVTYTPGYDKDWGGFLLSQWQYQLNENLKGTVHLDYRTRRDVAGGVDVKYDTDDYGDGIIRTYYMNERKLQSGQNIWEERKIPTIERERFKVEWRHKWDIDDKTGAIWQYYKLSDDLLLKDYFEREYEKDITTNTYFLLTKGVTAGTFSFRTDVRVNRFTSSLERLPEISYSSPSAEIAETGLYIKDTTTFSNLTSKSASPSENRKKTMRVDTDNELSYPMKVSFIELRPFVGGRQTYYSRTKEQADYHSIRGIFRTGADLSTKFYRIFDIYTDLWDLDIHRLRHIITPSVDYNYTHNPTMPNEKFDQLDGADSMTRGHGMIFSIENKLQTKRNEKSVDLARMLVSTNFHLKEQPGNTGGFNTITVDIDLKPQDWFTFYLDANYDTRKRELKTVNFDLYINEESDDWFLRLGKRWNGREDDQLTTEFGYSLNQKWKIKTYQQYDLDSGTLKEQEFNLRRDMHAWILDINYNQTRGQGSEIWLVFTLKAFPELGIDLGTSFNRRKGGSQSSE